MAEYVWLVELGEGFGIHLLRADQEALMRSYVKLGYKVLNVGADFRMYYAENGGY